VDDSDISKNNKRIPLPRYMGTIPLPDMTAEVDRRNIGRNEPCPCGSGKKFKQCCKGTNQPGTRILIQKKAP
jgi:uncharacterized protein YecA (UPF0149 family)